MHSRPPPKSSTTMIMYFECACMHVTGAGAKLDVRGGDRKRTALHRAAQAGSLECTEALLTTEAGRACLTIRDSPTGGFPLHSAAAYGTPGIVQAMLAAGAELNAEDDTGDPPIQASVGCIPRGGEGRLGWLVRSYSGVVVRVWLGCSD